MSWFKRYVKEPEGESESVKDLVSEQAVVISRYVNIHSAVSFS